MSESRDSQLFQSLLLQLHHAAWAAMGKIPHPLTGKVERDLDSARLAIDSLGALETRTANNLDAQERQLLDHLLRELRMNYVDEQRRAQSEPGAGADESDGQAPPFEKADAGGAASDEGVPPTEGTPTV